MHSPLFQPCFTLWTVAPVCLRQGWASLENVIPGDEWMEKRVSRVCMCSGCSLRSSTAHHSACCFRVTPRLPGRRHEACLSCLFLGVNFRNRKPACRPRARDRQLSCSGQMPSCRWRVKDMGGTHFDPVSHVHTYILINVIYMCISIVIFMCIIY